MKLFSMTFPSNGTQQSVTTAIPSVIDATEALAIYGSLEARGAISTHSEVVDFILDLSGYTDNQPLHEKRHLEPL
ncbi:MAG: modification methylase PaeR7I, partial [Deltaproteobacteria bacterium]|nr:modification methylase PaeR7I [Deltaproteobacteria bacterium]